VEVAPRCSGPRRGEIIPLPLSALRGSPFETYFALAKLGLILFCALGARTACGGPVGLAPASAGAHWRVGRGVALLIWMAVEIAIVGYTNSPPLQAFYMLLGAVITGLGLGWRMRDNLTYVAL
jgi:hypothetical protein